MTTNSPTIWSNFYVTDFGGRCDNPSTNNVTTTITMTPEPATATEIVQQHFWALWWLVLLCVLFVKVKVPPRKP